MSAFKEIPLVNGTATLPDGFAGGQVIFFDYRSAGLTAVKRPAYGADGPIIDHLSAEVVDKFINLVAEPELKACGSNPPFSFFCDSLEVFGSDSEGNWDEQIYFVEQLTCELPPPTTSTTSTTEAPASTTSTTAAAATAARVAPTFTG